jgi:hypothetical protein
MDPMAKAAPVNDAGAAAETLRDGASAPDGDAPVKVDVVKVLDRIAAALAVLDEARVPKRVRPITTQERAAQRERPRLRHNWG